MITNDNLLNKLDEIILTINCSIDDIEQLKKDINIIKNQQLNIFNEINNIKNIETNIIYNIKNEFDILKKELKEEINLLKAELKEEILHDNYTETIRRANLNLRKNINFPFVSILK